MTDRGVPDGGFRWECPFCGVSRVNASEEGESGEANAIAALRTHVLASDGAEHGPRNELPTGFETLVLAEHVTKDEGRRRRFG